VVAPRDVGAARKAIACLVGDTELRDRMGEAARRRAVEAFDNDRLVAQLALVARGDLSAVGPLCR
jgi:glycosyltransferase involved in cell wall biosynthesis